MLGITKERVMTILKILFPLILLGLAIFEIQKVVRNIDLQSFSYEMSRLSLLELVVILLVSILAITPMLFYDVILVRILQVKINTKSLVQQSFITNTFSNLIGFGGLIGFGLRTYFYSTYKEDKEGVIKNIASVTLFYLTGISILSWTLVLFFHDLPLLKESKWLLLAVLVVGLYAPAFLLYYRIRYRKTYAETLHGKLTGQLIAVSVLEWVFVFLVIWLLTFILKIPISFEQLIPIFLVASCAGIVSMIPGGLGSFDLVFLWGTQSIGIPEEKVLFLLILYRLGYFIIPFIISLLLFVKKYWDLWNQSWGNLPSILIQRISHILLTGLIFLSGIILLLSAAIPGIISRLKFTQELLTIPIMNVSHQLTVAAGFILLGLCRGISYKVKRTYKLAIIVLSSAAIFSIIKGFDYEEAIFLFVVLLLLLASKKQFYRESYVVTWGTAVFDSIVVLLLTAMFVLIGYANLPSTKFHIPKELKDYIITDYRDLFLSAIIGIVIAIVILTIGYVIRRPNKLQPQSSIEQESRLYEHFNQYGGTEYSHLVFLHDKYVFWNQSKTVFFMYQLFADKMVVLGNPVGDEKDISKAIEEFMDFADLYGYTLVFYEIDQSILPILHENGYAFFKLGEEAHVDLKEFTFTGKKMKSFRAVKNKFEREGYHIEIIDPPFTSELLLELEDVSKKWLQGRMEKGFSLGFFDKHYLNTSQVAILRDENGVLGFASLMPMYDGQKRISVDLMRFKPDAPSGTMDFIFLSLFEWGRDSGYELFNLGMSPLSNVGRSKYSFVSEKIASQIFLHGQYFYNFKGLKQFKQKYADFWESKYLAYRKKSSLTFTMAQVTLLIGKKRRIIS